MNLNKDRLKSIGKWLAKIALVLFILMTLFLGVSWHILKSDHEYVIEQLKEKALNDWNVLLQLEGYDLEWTNQYPLIQFRLKKLVLAKVHDPGHPFLKVNHLVSKFNPLDLLTGDFNAKPLLVDSVWVHLYKDSLNQSNLSVKQKNEFKKPTPIDFDLKEFPLAEINFLDVHHQDEYNGKWQRGQLLNVRIEPERIDKAWNLHLTSQCAFDGLVFKEKDGGYLMNSFGQFNLYFALQERGRKLMLNPSWLKIKNDTFHLEGQFYRRDTNRVQLQISHDRAMKDEVMPLLAEKLNRKLKDIQVDQPIKVMFMLNEKLVPDQKGTISVHFETENACAQYLDVDVTNAKLKGSYSNDCDGNGIGDLKSSCITFEKLDGDILGLIPAQLKGVINDLKDPYLTAEGQISIDLPRLNPLLDAKDKFTFKQGKAKVDFTYYGDFIEVLKSPFDEQTIQIEGVTIFEDVVLDPDTQGPFPAISGQFVFDSKETILEEMRLEWQGANIYLTGSISNLPEFMFYKKQALRSNLNLHFDHVHLDKVFAKTKNAIEGNQIPNLDYQQMEVMARKIASNINGEVHLSIDSLYYDTLFFTDFTTDLKLYSPLLAQYADSNMISIDQVQTKFMGLTPIHLSVGLSQGSVPDILLDIRLPSAVKSVNHFLPAGYRVYEGAASLALKAQLPLTSFSDHSKLLADIKYQGEVHLDDMNVRVQSFSWPVDDLTGNISFSNESIQFSDLIFKYKNLPFSLNGSIKDPDFVPGNNSPQSFVDLELYGRYVDLRSIGEINSVRENKKSDHKTPAELFRSLSKMYEYAEGRVLLKLDSIITDKHTVKPVLIDASLLSQGSSDSGFKLKVDSFNLGFGGPSRLIGNALIWNNEMPKIKADFKARMTFQQLGEFLPSDFIEMKEGYFKMDVKYESPLYDTLNAINYLLNAKVNGDAELVNGKLFYNYRDFTFNNIFGHFKFDQKAIFIRDLDLEINGNRLFAEGESHDFFAFFILPERRANIALKVTSPRFDFGGFTAPHGLGKDSLLTNVNVDDVSEGKTPAAGFIDQLLDQGSLEMEADFKSLVYNDFEGKNLKGQFSLQPDTVQLKNVQMDLADGSFKVDGAITDVIFHQPKMQVNVEMEKNDIREIFRQFENFGQDQLKFNNIDGEATAEVDFSASANSNYSVIPETMHSDIYIKLSGGELKNVPALKKLTGFLFKKRRLEHVHIDTLEMNVHVRGTDMYMDEFYLHSTSFDFGALGMYSFGKENNTRLLFGVPVSNLFRRHLTPKELENGTSKRKGMRVFVDVRSKKDKLRFRLKIPMFGKKKYRMKEESLPLENLRVD